MSDDEREFLEDRIAIVMEARGLNEQAAREFPYACYINRYHLAMARYYPLD